VTPELNERNETLKMSLNIKRSLLSLRKKIGNSRYLKNS
jgi:Galactose oxidase, central domain/Kelch motif